ncbi:hypothetical protein Pfo_012476 [Paulownia fortunei]|nr:hypothetical protein Pfo_012476 [Paulownia fortunei]
MRKKFIIMYFISNFNGITDDSTAENQGDKRGSGGQRSQNNVEGASGDGSRRSSASEFGDGRNSAFHESIKIAQVSVTQPGNTNPTSAHNENLTSNFERHILVSISSESLQIFIRIIGRPFYMAALRGNTDMVSYSQKFTRVEDLSNQEWSDLLLAAVWYDSLSSLFWKRQFTRIETPLIAGEDCTIFIKSEEKNIWRLVFSKG